MKKYTMKSLDSFSMLTDAIARCTKRDGAPPKRIEMSERLYRYLELEAERLGILRYRASPQEKQSSIMGVTVILTKSEDAPRLVTCNEVVEYI